MGYRERKRADMNRVKNRLAKIRWLPAFVYGMHNEKFSTTAQLRNSEFFAKLLEAGLPIVKKKPLTLD